MTLDLPAPPPLWERSTQVIVKLCDFGFARATQAAKAKNEILLKNQFIEKPGKVSIRKLPLMLKINIVLQTMWPPVGIGLLSCC